MKKLLLLSLLLVSCRFVLAQAANVPPCNGSNGPNCTDYFGVANWANSPLPAGQVVSLTLISGGEGYTNPTVMISDLADPGGSGATASASMW